MLCGQIPIRLDVHPVIHLRIAVVPQRWPARREYVWGLRVDPEVIQNPPDLHALGHERNQAHLSTAHGAQQLEHLIDSGDQHRSQKMIFLHAFIKKTQQTNPGDIELATKR